MSKQAAQVGVRELRKHLSAHLARVKKGKRIEVTEHGKLVALLVPPPPKEESQEEWLERMIAEGRATRPVGDLLDLGPPLPAPEGWPGSEKILEELREDTI